MTIISSIIKGGETLKRIGLFLLTNLMVTVTISILLTITFHFVDLPGSSGFPLYYFLLFSIVAGFSGAIISLLFSRTFAKRWMGVYVIKNNSMRSGTEKWLQDRVFEICLNAGLKHMPQVGIYQSPDMNAFATGPSKKRSLIAVSTGLLENMDADSIEAVLAHEVAHLENGDMITQTLIQGVVNSFAIFLSRTISYFLSRFVKEELAAVVNFVLSILFDLLFTALGSLVVLSHSRHREYRADALASKLVGKEKMIHALRILSEEQAAVWRTDKAIQTMQINNKSKFFEWLSTHPPIEKRIQALERQSL